MSPPGDDRGRPRQDGPDVELLTDVASVTAERDSLRRRRDAALRLAPLADGRRDPDMHRAAGSQDLDADDAAVGYCCAAMPLQEAEFCARAGLFCGPGRCARKRVAA